MTRTSCSGTCLSRARERRGAKARPVLKTTPRRDAPPTPRATAPRPAVTTSAPTAQTGWRRRLNQNKENDYLIDREAQASGTNYTGIAGIFQQDQAVTESMGELVDRTVEHLGTTDSMIIRTRRRLIGAARALQEAGTRASRC